jgi:hypothetical protein
MSSFWMELGGQPASTVVYVYGCPAAQHACSTAKRLIFSCTLIHCHCQGLWRDTVASQNVGPLLIAKVFACWVANPL